jgi:hypothetical protein
MRLTVIDVLGRVKGPPMLAVRFVCVVMLLLLRVLFGACLFGACLFVACLFVAFGRRDYLLLDEESFS